MQHMTLDIQNAPCGKLQYSTVSCPDCPDATLSRSDRQGVAIDCCPQCHGVWLTRGVLDTLIERAVTATALRALAAAVGNGSY